MRNSWYPTNFHTCGQFRAMDSEKGNKTFDGCVQLKNVIVENLNQIDVFIISTNFSLHKYRI